MRHFRLAVAGCALVLAPAAAAAQSLPGIYISPADGSQVGASAAVQITWSHESSLNSTSRSIQFNNTVVTDSFSYGPAPASVVGGSVSAVSDATLTFLAGTNTLTAYICGGAGGSDCASQAVTLTYVPPPPPAQRAVPVISLAPHGDARQDFMAEAATASYSGPAYVSMGQERALTLIYSSELSEPRPLVQVDVRDPSLEPAQKFSIKVRTPGGAWLTQTNGLQEAFYNNAGGGTDSLSRMAVQLQPGSLGTGLHHLEVEVTSHWTNPTATQSTIVPVKVLVLNRRQSPYGMGWWVAGVQQAFNSANGVLIDEGDGTVSHFHGSATAYVAPPGDRSTLHWLPGDSLLRLYPDGTRTVYGPGIAGASPAVRPHLYTRTKLGQTVSYAYHWDGRLASVTDPAGKQTVLGYQADAAGTLLLHTITAPGSRQSVVVRDSLVVDFYDADGVRGLRQVHTVPGRQSYYRPRSAGAWTTTLGPLGTVIRFYTPEVTVNNVPSVRLITYVTRPREFVLPAAGKGTSTAPLPRVHPRTPHTRIVGPRGDTTRVWSDRLGLPVGVVGPLGHSVSIQRDSEGRPTRIVQDGDTSYVAYNTDGTVQSTFDQAHDQQVSYLYETLGGSTFLRSTSQAGREVTHHRGALGQVDSIRVEGQTVARFTYDADFQVRTAGDAGGHVTEYFYSGNTWRNVDSVRVVTGTERQRSSSTYDAYGRTATVTDPLGRTTTITYDGVDRVLKQVAPGDSVRYQYNLHSLTSVTDAEHKRYEFVYNTLGWLEREKDPRGKIAYYGYDAGGNLASYTDRAGRTFSSQYDLLGRQTFLNAAGDTTRWGYDDPGRGWMWVRNAESADTLVYDGAGRLLHHYATMGGQRYEINSGYDASGPRNSIVTLRGTFYAPVWRDSMAYGFDARGRLGGLVSQWNTVTTVQYNTEDLPVQIGYVGTGSITLGYTPRHQISSVQYSVSALNQAFGATSLTYDIVDRLKVRTSPGMDSRQREHAYDALGRLSGYEDRKLVTIPPPFWCTEEYATDPACVPTTDFATMRLGTFGYSAAGNRTSTTYSDSSGASLSQGATFQASTNRMTGYAGWTMLYDSVGNLVRRYNGAQDFQYQWNSVGQLTAVYNSAVGWVYYGYNGLGMRVRRTAGGVTRRYLYDGPDLAAELDASGNRIRTYAYWPGVDQPHSMRTWEGGQSGAIHYYAPDFPTANVRGLFNTSGAVTHQYEYAPYGEAQSASGWPGNPLRFAARELDEGAGLYYVRARWYDPVLGRFISEDPIGLDGGINNYAYALNDPVNLSDPSGLVTCPGPNCLDEVVVVARARRRRAANAMRWAFLINKWNGISDRDSRQTSIMSGMTRASLADQLTIIHQEIAEAEAKEEACKEAGRATASSFGLDLMMLLPMKSSFGASSRNVGNIGATMRAGQLTSSPATMGRAGRLRNAGTGPAEAALAQDRRTAAYALGANTALNTGLTVNEGSSWIRALPLFGSFDRLFDEIIVCLM